MANKLNFGMLETEIENATSERLRRWSRREENPTVQMSLRMKASDYDAFRALCAKERRTNGEMIEIMMESYIAQQKREAGSK